MSLSNILLIPGIGQMSFRDALSILSPYSPRLAANFMDPAGSLYTDASRTTQVTTPGNRVRSFTNFVTGQPHGAASSDAKSPLWARYPATGRRNELVTSNLTVFPWTTAAISVAGNIGEAILTEDGTMGFHRLLYNSAFNRTSGVQYTLQFTARLQSGTRFLSINAATAFNANATFNLVSGTVEQTAAGTAAIQSMGNGSFVCSVTGTATLTGLTTFFVGLNINGIPSSSGDSYVGDGVSAIALRDCQVEVGGRTAPQRVISSADITEAGVRSVYGALFDGSDDCLQVSGFDLSNTDKVCVIAGVRKLSDAASAVVVEHGTSATNTGCFGMLAPSSAGANSYRFISTGASASRNAGTGVFAAAPDSAHLVGVGDTSAPLVRLRRNGSVVESSMTSQGAINYTIQTLNIGGQNNGASLVLNGGLSYLFICVIIPPDDVLTRIYRGLGPQIGIAV